MASVFRRKGDRRWTIAYFEGGRRREKASGTTDKRLAERIAASMSDRELERTRGLIDPATERLAGERSKPLALHIDDFEASLEALQRSERHVADTVARLRRVSEDLGWTTLVSIDPDALTTYLAGQSERRGTGAAAFNAFVAAWRAFCRWSIRGGRLATNPLAGVRMRNAAADRRRVRRDISPEELARVVAAAERAVEPRRRTRSSGADRAMLYRIAAGTGFRVGEIASLTPASFDLDTTPPTVTVEAAFSKRRRRDVQPIRVDLAKLLRPWLATKPRGEPIARLPRGEAGVILARDMAAARSAWIEEARTPAERAERAESDFLRSVDAAGRVADFHALRVAYISRVVAAGASLRESMELARHSDPRLTVATYSRASIHSLGRVLDRLPGETPDATSGADALRATGTDAARPNRPQEGPQTCPQKSPQSERRVGNPSAAERKGDEAASTRDVERNPLRIAALRGGAQRRAAERPKAADRIRTDNPLITKHARRWQRPDSKSGARLGLSQRGNGERCAGVAQRDAGGDSASDSGGDADPDPDPDQPGPLPSADHAEGRADEALTPLEPALRTLAAALDKRFPDPAAREAAIRKLLDAIDPGGPR